MTNAAVFGCATTGNTSFRRCKVALSKSKHISNSNSVPSTLGSRASGSGSGGNTKNYLQEGRSLSLKKRSASFTSSAAAAAGAAASTPKSGSGSGGYLSGAFQSGSHLSSILESKRSTSAVVRAASGSAAAQAQPPAEDGSSSENLDSADSGRNSKGLPSWFPMHDFCLTLPWGLFVALGGVAGFAIAGSTKSLIFGGGFGALLMVLGGLSLKKWKVGGSWRGGVGCSLLFVFCILYFVFRFFSRSNPARGELNSFHTRR